MTQTPSVNRQDNDPDETPEPRPIVRILLFFGTLTAIILLIVGLTAYLIYNSLSAPRHDAKGVADGVTVTAFASFDKVDAFPVGLASTSDGFVLTLMGSGTVQQLDSAGKVKTLIDAGKLSAPGWIAAGPDGTFAVVDYTSPDPGKAIGRLKHILKDGTVEVRDASQLPLFSQPAYDDAGNLYVTSPDKGQVWQCKGNDPCNAMWWLGPQVGNAKSQPVAVLFDPVRKAMLVTDAGTGSIYAVNMAGSASKDSPQLLYRENGKSIYGLALDDQDRVLFAVWHGDNGELYRLATDGSVTLLANGFRAPSAIVFREGKAYVANSDLLGISGPLFGVIQSPLRARPPFTVDVVTLPK